MLNLFRTKPQPAEGSQIAGNASRLLAQLRDQQRQADQHFTTLEREYGALAHRQDWPAAQRREELLTQLPAAREARDVLMLKVVAAEEHEGLISRELMPLYIEKRGMLEHRFKELSVAVDVPDETAFLALVRDSRSVEQLRGVLSAETGLPEYRREWDAVLALKGVWHDQQQERERLFSRLLAPGARPRGEAPPWQPTLRRLSELKACLRQGVSNAR